MEEYNSLIKLFRLLTPDEIQELTKISSGEGRVSLTKLLQERLDLDVPVEKKEEQSKDDTDDNVLDFKKKKVEEKDEGPLKKADRKDFNINKKGVVFILDLRDKLEYVRKILKKKEVIELYDQISNIDIEHERVNKDDMKKSSVSGILVNKRQY